MVTMENNTMESIYTMMVLRKLIIELKEISPYQNHLYNINSLINAVASNNINMINIETTRIENIYQPNNFTVHPLEYLQQLKQFDGRCIDIIRSMGYYFTGDAHALEDINKLLLICDRDKLIRAASMVYGEETIMN